MKQEWYNQCKLRRGSTESTAWIPSKFADVGKAIVVTKDSKSENWTVFAVYARAEYQTIKDQAHKSDDIWTATSGPEPRGNK